MTPDVNVGVTASRSDHPHHKQACVWLEKAIAFVDSLQADGGVEIPTGGPEWPMLRQLCLDRNLNGNDLPDAWLAAAVTHRGDHLATFDAGFKRLLRPAQLTVLMPI